MIQTAHLKKGKRGGDDDSFEILFRREKKKGMNKSLGWVGGNAGWERGNGEASFKLTVVRNGRREGPQGGHNSRRRGGRKGRPSVLLLICDGGKKRKRGGELSNCGGRKEKNEEARTLLGKKEVSVAKAVFKEKRAGTISLELKSRGRKQKRAGNVIWKGKGER